MFPLEWLPEAYRASWCVAGGHAACPGASQDIDVWVFGVATEKLDEVRAELLEHLKVNRLIPGRHPRFLIALYYTMEPGEETRSQELCNQKHITIKKVTIVCGQDRNRHLKPVHLMVTDASSPGEIIYELDISTHAIAVDASGRVWAHPEYTTPNQPPRRLYTANIHTEPRMQRICARFGHPYTPPEAVIGEI